MRNVAYLGLYTTRADAGLDVLHRANESGLWQAWREDDGAYFIQALDVHRQPQGNFFSLAADDFFYALNALPAENAAAVQRHFLRSDSPHLLEAWFDQTRAAQEQETTLGLLPADAQILSFAEVFGGASPGRGSQQKDSGPEDFPALAGPAAVLIPVSDPDLPPAGPPIADSVSPEEFPSPEERIARLEFLMRVRFADLLAQLDTRAEAEAELRNLLEEKAEFSWKQKYMFSEFGMALRRKGRKQLARAAHLRALDLAPEDGHILFNLARSEYEMGNIPGAKEYLVQALAILPNFVPALDFLAFLDGREQS